MKTAAIFTVGTSVGGTPEAITEVLKQEPQHRVLNIYLLHGQKGDDNKNPREFVQEIKSHFADCHLQWHPDREIPSFDFKRTWEEMRAIISEIDKKDYDRVYVGITGGTNPMVASLFQAAMTYLNTQVVPVYSQSFKTDWRANFVASDIRDQAKAEEVLATARSGQIRVAARLAEYLPKDHPRWGFIRKAVAALASWDDFDYDNAEHDLIQLARPEKQAHAKNELLAPLARTVARLAVVVKDIKDFTKQIRDVSSFPKAASSADFADRVRNTGTLLVADTLANAQRRLTEGRYTDAVLRSYRAAECASQMCLFSIGIHPERPDAAIYEKLCGQRPKGNDSSLSFWAGLNFFENAKKISRPEEICKSLKNLSQMRNKSYLEHGYVRINEEQAKRSYEDSQKVCTYLVKELGCDSNKFMEQQKKLQMHF